MLLCNRLLPSSFERLIEERQRSFPGEFGAGSVKARRRVVVEAVLGAGVLITAAPSGLGRRKAEVK